MAGIFDDLVNENTPVESDDIFADLKQEEESDQTVLGSIARGAGAGLVDIAQGISELGTSGLEYAGVLEEEDDSQRRVTQFFTDAKETLGFTPERTAGKVAETIVNYGAPGLGVFSWVSKADRARRALAAGQTLPKASTWFGKSAQAFGRTTPGKLATSTAVGRAALTTAGTGMADFFVSPSTMTTLADNWDAMPEELRTESEEGLIGKELSAVRTRNKFRLGVEGMMFNAAGEVILPVAGGVVRSAASIPGVPTLARAIAGGFDYLGNKVGSVPFVKKYITPNGFTPPEIATAIRTAEGMTEAEEQVASKLVSDYDSAIKKAIRLQRLTGRGPTALQRAYNDTMDYITGNMQPQDFTSAYGKKATSAVDAMRNQIDDLSQQFQSSVNSAQNLTAQQKTNILQQFQNNQGVYIRRLYELHLNPEKFSTINARTLPQYQQARQQVATELQRRNPQLPTGDADRQAESMIDDIFNESLLQSGLSPEARARQVTTAVAQGFQDKSGRTSLFKLTDGMLTDRDAILDNAPMLREMMGEVRNPREAFLRTIDNMSTTMASQRLYDTITASGVRPLTDAINAMNAGGRPLVIDGTTVLTEGQAKDLSAMGYVKAGEFDPDKAFGGTYGSLSGNYVPVEVFNSLSTPARTYSGAQDALAVALQLKGMSQMSKTVLNPLSQVRNFLSNTFVIGANGLLGRNTGLFESAEVLLANAIDSPEQYKLLRAMGNEGAIGQNIQLNELTRLLKEQTENGVSARLQKTGDAFRRSKIGAPVRFMEKTYQIGDDYWKVVGALGEKARYGAALRKGGVDIDNVSPAVQDALVRSGLAQRASSIADTDFGDLLAIDLVKQTMPTYSMVPEAIKQIRRIPVVGNFMAFPAEIIRTSGNIVNRAVKEMGFKATPEMIQTLGEREARRIARQIRGIGAQRLTGYMSMAGVAPYAMRDAAHSMLEITPEQEEALDKFGPFWSLGNIKMFLTQPDDKLEAEYVDLSYMLPYEFMFAPARAALQTYVEKGEIGAAESEQILAASWEAFKKFAEPFASESLGAERVIDVTTRQGKTATGASIYEEAEPWGDKLAKSLNHVAGAFVPGLVDQFLTVRGGEFVEGRTARAISGTPSKEGDPYTIAEEAGTMLTGLRSMKFNGSRSLGYGGGEYSALRSSAVKIFTSKADDNDATAEEVVAAYIKANESRRRQQAEMKAKIDAAMDAGMSAGQVRLALRNSGISNREISLIMQNRYVPFKVSRNLIREVSEEVNRKKENRILQRLPMAELNKARFELNNTPIVGETPERQLLPDPTDLFGDLVPTAPAPDSTNIFNDLVPTAPAPAAPTPTTPAQVQEKRSTILGTASNPIAALRDLEIFQRSQD